MTDTSRQRNSEVAAGAERSIVVAFLAESRAAAVTGAAFSGEAFEQPDTTNVDVTIIAVVKKNKFPVPNFDRIKPNDFLEINIDRIVPNSHSSGNLSPHE